MAAIEKRAGGTNGGASALFEVGSHVRVTLGPHRGRTAEVLGRREVIASGAAAALADDASTQTTNWHYEIRFDRVGETVSMSQAFLGN